MTKKQRSLKELEAQRDNATSGAAVGGIGTGLGAYGAHTMNRLQGAHTDAANQYWKRIMTHIQDPSRREGWAGAADFENAKMQGPMHAQAAKQARTLKYGSGAVGALSAAGGVAAAVRAKKKNDELEERKRKKSKMKKSDAGWKWEGPGGDDAGERRWSRKETWPAKGKGAKRKVKVSRSGDAVEKSTAGARKAVAAATTKQKGAGFYNRRHHGYMRGPDADKLVNPGGRTKRLAYKGKQAKKDRLIAMNQIHRNPASSFADSGVAPKLPRKSKRVPLAPGEPLRSPGQKMRLKKSASRSLVELAKSERNSKEANNALRRERERGKREGKKYRNSVFEGINPRSHTVVREGPGSAAMRVALPWAAGSAATAIGNKVAPGLGGAAGLATLTAGSTRNVKSGDTVSIRRKDGKKATAKINLGSLGQYNIYGKQKD